MVQQLPLVVVLSTGGTIASTVGPDGVSTPTLDTGGVLGAAAGEAGVRVHGVEVLQVDSATMTLDDVSTVRRAVVDALADPGVSGVVVLHGTDSMEETAFVLDLHHDDERPVVLTGSQRTADHPHSDASANVVLALRTAVDATSRGRGVLVAFAGRVLQTPGLTKRHTSDLDAFSTTDPALLRAGTLSWTDAPWPRVDVVALHPGADGLLLEACVVAGARGIVLEALGAGNATRAVVEGVRRCTAAGVVVALTTRVPLGAVVTSYGGGGGGHELVAAGAVDAGALRAGQTRVLLATLLRSGTDRPRVSAEFAARS